MKEDMLEKNAVEDEDFDIPDDDNMQNTKQPERSKIKSLNKIGAIWASLIILAIIGTISWFTMSREVENSGLQMTAEGTPFEIRVSGNNTGALTHTQTGVGDLATYTSSEIYGLASSNSYLKKLANGTLITGSTYETNATNSTIKWRLSQAYDSEEDKGFGPDSQGELSFSIVPTQSGELNPSFKMRLEGYIAPDQRENDDGTYQVMENKILPIASDSTDEQKQSVTYLNGHILFFSSRTNVGTNAEPVYEYSGLLDENDIKLSDIVDSSIVTNGKVYATQNTAITATIYWIWSNTFGQMVFSANENNSKTPVGHNSETRSDIQNYILENTLSVFDETSFEFESGTSEADKITAIKNMMAVSSGTGDEITYSFSATKVNTGTNLDVLTLAYNSADQKIGTHIDYVLLALSINNQ